MKYEISITQTTSPKEKPVDESKLGFGKIFTDHMFIMDFNEELGWHDARIVPFGPLPIHPASTVLHYGAEIFEGMKAYRQANGDIALFRPLENIRRLNNSAERLCLQLMRRRAWTFSRRLSRRRRIGFRTLRVPLCIFVRICSAMIRIWVFMPLRMQCLL